MFDGVEKKMHKKIMKQHKGLVILTKEWNKMTIVNYLEAGNLSILLCMCI
jgi:hypothetical protein